MMLRISSLWLMITLCCTIVIKGQQVFIPEYRSSVGTSELFDLLHRAEQARSTYPDSALLLSRKALQVSLGLQHTLGIAKSFISIATGLLDKNEIQESKAALYAAVPFCRQAAKEDRLLLPSLYNNLGNAYTREGYWDSALHYYYQALASHKVVNRKDTSLLLRIYSNMGGSFAKQQQSRQALYYLRNSLSLSLLYKDSQVSANNYVNLGLAFENSGKGDSALYYYNQSIILNRLLHNKMHLQTAYYRIGITYGRQGDFDMAKVYFDSAVTINPQNAALSSALQTGLGNVYSARGQYKLALPFYERAIEMATQKGIKMDNLATYYNIAESYHQTGNNRLAFTYQKTYSDLKDSLTNSEKMKILNQLEIQYRTAAQEKDLVNKQLLITRQQKKILQKNFWIGGIAVGALLLISLLIVVYRNYNNKQKLQLAEMANLRLQQLASRQESLKQGEESERIRIARDLHDGIGSILAAARMHLDIFKDNHELPGYAHTYKNGMSLLDEAYQGLRYTAHNLLPPEQLMEQGLVAATKLYCTKISKQDTFTVHFQHYGPMPDMAPETAVSFYRIIQELVHNAAKHAEAKEVIVEIGMEENQLSIIVEDNGLGWKTPETDVGNGMGIRNLKERVVILGGSLEVDSRQGIGTTVYISCLLENNTKNHDGK